MPKELMAQNNALVKRYGVGGFPTIMVLAEQGHALGGFTGGMTRLPDVVKLLEPAWQVFQNLKAAEGDAARCAEHLAAAYALYPDSYRKHNVWLREILEAADPADKTGWKATRAAEQQMQQLQDELPRYIMSRHAMLDCYNRYLAEALPGNRSRILVLKSRYLNGAAVHVLRRARTVEDVLVARDLQLQAADCEENPTERQEIIRRVHEAYATPEALLPKQGKFGPRLVSKQGELISAWKPRRCLRSGGRVPQGRQPVAGGEAAIAAEPPVRYKRKRSPDRADRFPRNHPLQ
ncbi:MAG: hypothetical protein IKW19_09615 [Akkermansia sp.]|nr:hypothetical protein [Akkermansia sp.]